MPVPGNDMSFCKICGGTTKTAFTATALRKYKFEAITCPQCGFLQVKEPTWLEEAYSDAISAIDTGLVARNLSLATQLNPLLFYLFGAEGRFVDFAGGTGLLVRLMRDAGYDFYWHDPYSVNAHARGFEYEKNQTYQAVTAFEALEHIIDPIEFVKNAFNETGADAMFFTTELFAGAPPEPGKWWYYAFEAGQHISFYQTRTLGKIADALGVRFSSNNGMHVFAKPKVIDKLWRYNKYTMVRRFAKYQAAKALKTRTFDDHVLLVGKS